MIIQFNTGRNIQGSEKFEMFVSEQVKRTLKRFSDNITRVKVHISDQNAQKAGPDDIQCKIELRVRRLQPIMVKAKSNTREKALNSALDKTQAMLETVLGKLNRK